jgi:hypothetical protein
MMVASKAMLKVERSEQTKAERKAAKWAEYSELNLAVMSECWKAVRKVARTAAL